MSEIRMAEVSDHLYSKAAARRIPISGTFELTPLCNFACRMCYVRKTPEQVKAHDRAMLEFDDWLRIAREGREQGMLFLLLTGGEPLLWPRFWELYEKLVDMGMLVAINTNGSLIDDEAIERFKRRPPRRVNITLYGGCDDTYQRLCGVKGVFDRVDRAVRGLKEAGIPVKLNCSLTPHNAADLEAITAYAKELDLRLDLATYMFPPIRRDPDAIGVNDRFTPEETARYRVRGMELLQGQEAANAFLQRVKRGCAEPPGLEEGCYDPIDGRIRCRAGSASFWITWDGFLTACGMMPQPRVELTGRAFADAWQALADETAALRLSGVCGRCENRELCHPCAAMAAAETGTASGVPQYLCHVAKALRRMADGN